LESETLAKIHRRTIRNFLDVVILLALKNRPLSGSDVMSFVHDKFHMLLSTGTVYAYLYALERNGLVKGEYDGRRRVYTITESGKQVIKIFLNDKDKISRFVLNIFSG